MFKWLFLLTIGAFILCFQQANAQSPTPDARPTVNVTIEESVKDPVTRNAYVNVVFTHPITLPQPTGTEYLVLYTNSACNPNFIYMQGLPTTLDKSAELMNIQDGFYWLVAYYSGDSVYQPSHSICNSFPVDVSPQDVTSTPTAVIATLTPGPSLTPTPVPAEWSSDIKMLPFCQVNPGWITLSSSVIYTPNMTGPVTSTLSTLSWNDSDVIPVCPPDNLQCGNKNAAVAQNQVIGSGTTVFTRTVWWSGVLTGSVWSETNIQLRVLTDAGSTIGLPFISGGRFWRQTECIGTSTPAATATQASTSTVIPTSTRTPIPSLTSTQSPLPSITPAVSATPTPTTPIVPVWNVVYTDDNNGLLCKYDSGWITTTAIITLSPLGSHATDNANWYKVSGSTCPPGDDQCDNHNNPSHMTNASLTGGVPLTLTQVIWWPGIGASDTFVQVDRNMTVSGADGRLLVNSQGQYSIGTQTLWSSYWTGCPVPTSVPTVTPSTTPASSPTIVKTSTTTPTNVPTFTNTPVPTNTSTLAPTVTQSPLPTKTYTAVPTATATSVPQTSVTLHKGWNWIDAIWLRELPISSLSSKPHVLEFSVWPTGVLILADADIVLIP